jgi:hypothetical protein
MSRDEAITLMGLLVGQDWWEATVRRLHVARQSGGSPEAAAGAAGPAPAARRGGSSGGGEAWRPSGGGLEGWLQCQVPAPPVPDAAPDTAQPPVNPAREPAGRGRRRSGAGAAEPRLFPLPLPAC